MDPSEVEFLAEKELVTITPNFSENKICLISVCRQNSYSSVVANMMSNLMFAG